MKHPVQRLQSELHYIADLLDQGSLFSFTAKERESVRDEAANLSQELASIESSFLTTGLVGGTGVGKSTLMNALAGAEIASTSHRRPHTDRVLIYRHAEANPLPSLPSTDIAWKEIVHKSDAIQQILLCDLPDFDSLMGEHREHVLQFMEHLDVLIWVTSPEKYADGRFYEFLRMVPKAKQNFYFLLNKVDLLFHGETLETGYKQMEQVARSFLEHIRENGIDEPILYAFSAQEAFHSDQVAPWNQFPAFRQQIFQQRDVKQVTAIKAANLDVEIQRLLSFFEKEVLNLKSFERILEDSEKELGKQRSSWVQAGQEAIDLWLGKYIRQQILSSKSDPSRLVGPGYGLALLVLEWKKRFKREQKAPSDLSSFVPPDECALSFQSRLEWLEDRLNHRTLRKNLPQSFRERLQETLRVGEGLKHLKERFSHIVALRVAEPSLPSLRSFKVLQFLTYLLLVAFFLLAVGGETAWRAVLEDPGVASTIRLFLSCVYTLFSTKGLAALGSFALLNIFIACRFYARYRKLSRRGAEKILESLKVELVKVWEEKLDGILEDLNQFKAEIRSQVSAISSLKEKK